MLIRGRSLVRHIAGFAFGLCAISSAFTADAQAPSVEPPPVNRSIDPNGVDVISGQYIHTNTPVSIGDPSAGGLVYERTYTGIGWRDNLTGTIFQSDIQVIVSIGGISEEFLFLNGAYTPTMDTGATLVKVDSTTYLYTSGSGVKAQFTTVFNQPAGQPEAIARIEWMVFPNGDSRTFEYQPLDVRVSPSEPETIRFWRVAQVTSSRGYGVWLTFLSEQPVYQAELEDAFTVRTATAYNAAVDVCNVNNWSCTFSKEWPSATFTDTTVTDQADRVTTYTFGVSGITGITLPAGVSPDVAVSYSNYRVSGVTNSYGAWTYAYSDNGNVRTTTTSGPLSQARIYVSDTSSQRVTSITDAQNHTNQYAYDGHGRLLRITQPEGNYVDYVYGPRGNITETRLGPKTATVSPLVFKAEFPATCVNTATCNQPIWTEGPNGARTDYTYDNSHGGVLTITEPAPYSGAARPETRYTYTAQYPWFRDWTGQLVQGGAHYLLTEVSACATGSVCDGAATEVVTTLAYGSSGVKNNLLPTAITSGSGDGVLAVTTAMTYDDNGDMLTLQGPLASTLDVTHYRYDDVRRVVGIIGPDPDGVGSGLNRARRFTYNARGQVTRAETGTAAGGVWANFAPLLTSETDYDQSAYFRPLVNRLMSGAGAISGIQQVSYDAAGRPSCIATRMNPAEFASLPASACTLDDVGPYGPDRITKTTYDPLGRPLSETSAFGTTDAITEIVSYTTNGQVGTITDGKGNVSVRELDAFDRLAKLRYPNPTGGGTSTADYEQFAYDSYGRPYSARNRAGAITYFGYDALNRRIMVNYPTGTPDVTSAYDNLGRLTLIGNEAIAVSTTWDALSRPVVQASSGLGAMEFGYDGAGRTTDLKWPDGFVVTYTRDLYGAVTAVQEHPVGGNASTVATYGWNNLGQLTGLSRAGGTGASSSWGYDAWARLSSLSHDVASSTNDLSLVFAYNPANQIVSRGISNSAYLYAPVTPSVNVANNGLNQTTTMGATALDYDANGNLEGIANDAYGFDAVDRMTSATTGSGTAAFTFDPMGRLATISLVGSTSRFQYMGDQIVGEYGASGTILNRFVPGVGLDDVVVAYAGAGTTNRSWPLVDERGSVIAQSDVMGVVSTINRYDEFGVPAVGNVGRFQYTGQAWIAEAQAYHYRARTYLPSVGRFFQPDPVRYAAGANIYAYTHADPINRIDPLGLQEEPTDLGELTRYGRRPECSAICIDYLSILNSHSIRRVAEDYIRPGVFDQFGDLASLQSCPTPDTLWLEGSVAGGSLFFGGGGFQGTLRDIRTGQTWSISADSSYGNGWYGGWFDVTGMVHGGTSAIGRGFVLEFGQIVYRGVGAGADTIETFGGHSLGEISIRAAVALPLAATKLEFRNVRIERKTDGRCERAVGQG